jgi:hypothetical protein
MSKEENAEFFSVVAGGPVFALLGRVTLTAFPNFK